VRSLFGAQNPIGRRIQNGAASYTVIGVTHDVRSGWLRAIPVPTVFLPLTAGGMARSRTPRATVLVRVAGGPAPLAAVRGAVASLHPDLTIFNVHTMRENLDRINAFAEWSTAVYFVLGLFSLLLACIGLGGVTAYAVAQRRKEIGIRMALGARGASARVGAEGRDGAGSGGLGMRLWRRAGPGAGLLRDQRAVVEGFRPTCPSLASACRSTAALGRPGDAGLLLPGAACDPNRSRVRAAGGVSRQSGHKWWGGPPGPRPTPPSACRRGARS
jgi:hypothetical protein